jgi:alanyl-tRNA synthetase
MAGDRQGREAAEASKRADSRPAPDTSAPPGASPAPTLKLYDADAYLLDFDARIVALTTHGGRPAVVLDQTAFYAEGGGQPWDLGTLDGVAVTAVVEQDGRVLHVLERALDAQIVVGASVHGRVDGARRRDHRQQHHGQHLLSRAFVELHSVATHGFHLGSEAVTIDLARAVSPAEIDSAVRRANEVVQEARPVRVRTLSLEEARDAGHAPPADARAGVRLVDAGGFDAQPCSGTHPSSTAEVGPIVVLRPERHKGATRLHFVCGMRALDAVAARLRALDEAGALLSAAPETLAAAARQALDDLRAARKLAEDRLARALRGEARDLAARAEPGPEGRPLVAALLEAREPAELRALAVETCTVVGGTVLLGARGDGAQLAFARVPGSALDVAGALRAALAVLGGRGGGRGDVVQGGAPSAAQLEAALDAARAALS